MNFNIFPKRQPNDNSNDAAHEIQLETLRELLREMRLTFNFALFVNAASAIITLAGVLCLYLDKVPEASVITAGGVLGSLCSLQSAKAAKEELREMMRKLEK